MSKKYWVVIGGLLAALLVVSVIGATAVYAQDPTPPAGSLLDGGHGPGHGFWSGTTELEAAAKVLGMTTDELKSALQSGKTLEELATSAGVDIEDVRAAIQEAHVTEMRERIQQAVTDGKITQENADWLLEGLDKGFIGVPGAFGFGHGFGGPNGHGMGDGPMMDQTPAQDSQ
jgi:Spy/CpxP family protein refolding chaperone